MRKRAGVIALAVAGALGFGGTYAKATTTNTGVPAKKFIVVDKLAAASKAKAVFVAKDPAITKGTGTDVALISITFEAAYDNSVDAPISGEWDVPQGGPDWKVNKSTVAKYVNKVAPTGTDTKVAVAKPLKLIKLVAKGLGETTFDVLSQDSGGTKVTSNGVANTKYCIDNDGEVNCFCSTFSACTWKSIAADTGAKLVCKGGTSNPTCSGFCPVVPPATSCGGAGTCVSFVTAAAGGTCGSVRSGGTGGTVRKSLGCGGLNVGGGNSTVAEGPTPGNAQTLLNTAGGPVYTVTARTAAQTGSNLNCSDTGCVFGPYLPISNSGTSTCVQNTFASPASGTLDGTTGAFNGSFPLTSTVYLTANGTDPCPRCLGGCPGVPSSGTCDPGWTSGVGPSPDSGMPCMPTDSAGDTYDCAPPVAAILPSFPVGLTPISTGTAFKYNAGGLFCPSQANSGAFGCSGGASGGTPAICPSGTTAPLIDYIEEVGSATPLGAGQTPTTIGSVFCIPSVGGGLGFLINSAANLPGPGATSLPGTLDLLP